MNKEIYITYDKQLNAYIVRFHDMVELKALKEAKQTFECLIKQTSGTECFSVLWDTGAHEFDSIECLKYCRSFLSFPALVSQCVRLVTVAPSQYMKSEIKSNKEASFNCYDEAYAWLHQQM